MRREIDALWTINAREAIAIVEHTAMPLTIVSYEADMAAEFLPVARAHALKTLMLLPPTRASGEHAPLSAQPQRTDNSAPIDDLGHIRKMIEQSTNVRFAEEPRVDLRFNATIEVRGKTIDVETANVSTSGVLLCGIAAEPQGTPTRVTVALPTGTIEVEAQ